MAGNGLSNLEDVPFDTLQLDPNNPRIAPRPAPGYADPGRLFDVEVQKGLPDKVFAAYKADDLEKTITSLGWAPVDPIIAWRHPDRPDLALVVEGNTRTSILRRARKRLSDAKDKLAKLKASGRGSLATEVEEEVAQLQSLVDDTQVVRVQFVLADTAEDLKRKLPRLLGVRHVSGAKNWSPYATNVYISDLYEGAYNEEHPGKPLRLDDDLIKEAARVFSLRPADARRMIQAASAFDHFKLDYGDRVVAAGNVLDHEAQYFFDQIIQHKVARDEFDVDKNTLKLSDVASEALFEWAFSKPWPKKTTDTNENVFKKAEDIRAWQALSKYDVANSTNFAAQLDVSNPKEAPSIRSLVNRMGQHAEQASPLQTLASLAQAFEKLPAANLVTQAEMLEPILRQVRDSADRYLDMIAGAQSAPKAA